MSKLDQLLDLVKNQISNRTQHHEEGAKGGWLDKLGSMLGGRKSTSSQRGPIRDVRPASEDPYGDPADEIKGRNVRPASEDPYGDPADEPRRR